ncbi:putative RiPP precursor [Thioclava indica]|nr:putative RiPP precursor [Thioclava indica]
MQKKTYATPTLRQHGKLEDMTHGQSTGSELDHMFPDGTPFSHLTFS